jgi:peptidoglycan/LPS O-acetylase OafA/YrhL
LGLILFSIFFFNSNTAFPGFIALVPTVGTLLIILFGKKKTLVNYILSKKYFVWLGLLSYSAYLWHQHILAFSKYMSVNNLTFYIGQAFVYLSYRCPILRGALWKSLLDMVH